MSKKTKELRLEVDIIVTMALIAGLVAVWCTFYYVYHIYPTQTYHVFPLVTIAPAFLSNCLFLACLFSYIVRRIQLSKQYWKDDLTEQLHQAKEQQKQEKTLITEMLNQYNLQAQEKDMLHVIAHPTWNPVEGRRIFLAPTYGDKNYVASGKNDDDDDNSLEDNSSGDNKEGDDGKDKEI